MILGPSIVVSVERARRLHGELLHLIHAAGVAAAPEALALVDDLHALITAVDDAASGRRPLCIVDDTHTLIPVTTAAHRLGLAPRTVRGHLATGRLDGIREGREWRVLWPQ